MPDNKMHADEIDISADVVARLIAAQFSMWDTLPLRPVPSAGTDNALYRLGDGLVVRLPRTESAARQIDKEQRWLPVLAPDLPLAIPAPVAVGRAGEGYPLVWSVYRWILGDNATLEHLKSPADAALRLAQFIRALQHIDTTNAPLPGAHNFGRGVPLAERDTATRKAIAACDGLIDTAAATVAWEAALEAPAWHQPPVWIHGDLQSGNLLAVDGKLSAVIDFGGLAIGDPACDLLPAWNLFSGTARHVFRDALDVDDATWARGRGWALSVSVIALPYYLHINPTLADISRRAINAVLSE